MGEGALDGLKVVELAWVITGPFSGKLLADHGATVVRVETPARPDLARSVPPYKGRLTSIDRSVHFAEFNSNKYSICLHLAHPDSKRVMNKLISWADVLLESFRPGALDKLGLGFDQLTCINPQLVMVSSTGYGQDGPDAGLASYGTVLASIAGFHALTGWPDRDPAQTYSAYTDFLAPPLNVAALLAATDHAQRTRTALHLDISQLECAAQFVAPLAMEYLANGRDLARAGNKHPKVAPHAVYRCNGEDEWCAIAAFDDAEWEMLCEAIGKPELLDDERFRTGSQRKAHEEELDAIIEEWTLSQSAEEAMVVLQAVGVRAGKVHDPQGLFEDPQIDFYRCFEPLEHPELGEYYAQMPPFSMLGSPREIWRAAPCLDQDTLFVCTSLLGIEDEEFAALSSEGVFG